LLPRERLKTVSSSEASNYILGYTIGNDLTSRLFQDPKRCGGQFTYAKAFDKFAPLGPRLVSPKVFEEHVKTIETRVNGKTVQKSAFEFIFPVNELVSFLSQGE
jgi:2-keto-4-pentenoate hydratase/2-oxohepta-3-ene-1,7-dioic acid hydratase in catechol pathway